MPPALSVIGPKRVHGQDVGGGHQHAHGGDGGAVDPGGAEEPGVDRKDVLDPLADVIRGESAAAITSAAAPVVSKPTEMPEMMLVAGPVRDCLHDLLHGTVATARVVLRDPDEDEGGGNADDAADQVLDFAVRQHPEAGKDKAKIASTAVT